MGTRKLRVAVISVGIVLQFVIMYTGLTVQLSLEITQPDGFMAVPEHGQVDGRPCSNDSDCSETIACSEGFCKKCRQGFTRIGNYCKDDKGFPCSKHTVCPDKSTVCNNEKGKCVKCNGGYFRYGHICMDKNECCENERESITTCTDRYNPCKDKLPTTYCVNTDGGYLCSFDEPEGQVDPPHKSTPAPKDENKKPIVVESAPIQSADAVYIWWMMGMAIAALLIIFIGRTVICLKKNCFSSNKLDIEDDNA